MKKIMHMIMCHTSVSHELGHMIIRIGIGALFLMFGYGKLTSGTQHLTQLGSAMGAFGITSGYAFWGLLAALTELCGGLAYISGFLTRIASIPLIWLLIVALKFHILKDDPSTVWAFPALCLCIVVGLLIAGSGKYSIDYIMTRMHE